MASLPPSGDVAAIEPATAGLALVAAVLAVALLLVARKVLRRERSGVGP
jgi:hypothetical protein